jgi:hypothetical protein
MLNGVRYDFIEYELINGYSCYIIAGMYDYYRCVFSLKF